MNGLLTSIRLALEKLSTLPDACGGFSIDKVVQQPSTDCHINHIFALQSLSPLEFPEAARATLRAIKLLHEKRDDDAIRELHDAKQQAPKCSEACCNLGGAYHTSGDDSASLFWYREAYRLCPRSDIAVLALSSLEHFRGQSEEAQQLLVTFLQEVDPAHIGVLKQLAKVHQTDERFSKAAGCYHRLIAIDPSNPEWSCQLQACLDKVECKDETGNALQGMLARAISFAEPVVRGAAPANIQEALEVTSRLSNRRGPQPPPTSMTPLCEGASGYSSSSCTVRNARGSLGRGRGRTQLDAARQFREAGCAAKAIDILMGLLQQDNHNAEAIICLTECQRDLGDSRAALEAAKWLIDMCPSDVEANLLVAELLLASGQDAYGSAMDLYLKQAVAGQAESKLLQGRVLCACAEAALGREDYATALANAEEAVRLDAAAAQSLIVLGTCRLRIAEYPAALRAFVAAFDACGAGVPTAAASPAELTRLRAGACLLAAQAHERSRQFEQAMEEARRALDLNPQLSAARVIIAMVYQQTGREQEAEQELKGVLQREPHNASAKLQLGYFRLCSGDAAGSVALLEAVVSSAGCRGAPFLSRSCLGAAKLYLALAIEGVPQRNFRISPDALCSEAVALHRNLRQVWVEIESRFARQPSAAVQRLRGICDLDLSSQQARQVLALLCRAQGRPDIALRCEGVGQQSRLSSAAGSHRALSVPPPRWAPPSGPSFDVSANVNSSVVAARVASDCVGRLRSISRAAEGGVHPIGGGHPSSIVKVVTGVSETPLQGWRRSRGGSREPSPGRDGNSLELSWSEVISSEQLVFGPLLGSGGSAKVFRGMWNTQEVAIKKISGVAHLEEMTKEINALRALRHPRLVRFMGACIQPPLLLVVTEFMSGGSLHDRLFGARKHPQLPGEQVWTIAFHMLEGLGFLHAQRVVHRDLKAMNVLLDSSDNAKICDFGLAQQMHIEATHIARNVAGEGGSPRYMAPECYDAAHGKLTEKVDVWALGCILIELYSGVLAYWDCSTMPQITKRILVERRPPEVPASVTVPVASSIRRCLIFDPKMRPTVHALIVELSQARGVVR